MSFTPCIFITLPKTVEFTELINLAFVDNSHGWVSRGVFEDGPYHMVCFFLMMWHCTDAAIGDVATDKLAS